MFRYVLMRSDASDTIRCILVRGDAFGHFRKSFFWEVHVFLDNLGSGCVHLQGFYMQGVCLLGLYFQEPA